MKTRLSSLAAALGLVLCSLSPGAAATAATPVTHTVTIDSLRYQVDDLAVKAGDTVIWINKDPFPHTVTSKAGKFDSHEILPGKSWKYVPAAKGEFAYICTLHPTMKGMLRVK